ncbi:trithorax-like protein 2 [Perilla frutescens var. hirtella]|nr:trithorax-like protein 2 [Perilla frutescens var. frutescens]KAH6786482.1 trithorax-like protein 2 [Perilla frutescens var. hirtella]
MAADALPPSADENGGAKPFEGRDEDEFHMGGAPLKYIPLCDVYSATSPCVTPTGSKKAKVAARKTPQMNGHDQLEKRPITEEPQFGIVYSRRRKRAERTCFLDALLLDVELEADGKGDEGVVKRRRLGRGAESVELGRDSKLSRKSDDPTSLSDGFDKTNCKNARESRNVCNIVNNSRTKKRKNDSLETDVKNSGAQRTKKWVRLSFEGVDLKKFIGLECKVYWPLDADWYSGHITGYNSETGRHHVKYEDGEEENLMLPNERIKFHVSIEEMQIMELKFCEKSSEADEIDINEMMVLAASLDDCQEIETGDLIWAKLTGHAVWPAIVLDESNVGKHKGLNKISGEKFVLVQFFGTHDFARVARKQVISFLKGLLSSCHSKCKKPTFIRGLEEAKIYLSEQRLPKRMLQLRDGIDGDANDSRSGEHEDGADSDGESMSHDEISKKLDDLKSCALEDGELQIVSLGKIVKDSSNFQNERFIWPEGYTAVRMFPSLTDPTVHTLYKMEVLRDVDLRSRPLFRVTADNGEEFNGPTPSACWNKIYKKIRVVQIRNRDYKADQSFASGSYMFGFTHPKVSRLIKEMSNSRSAAKSSQLAHKKMKNSSNGYRPVTVTWIDLDKCNVCNMDEEYENNLFLQCDKCRIMVHAKCYGEFEPTGGVLWLCNLCRPGAPEPPPCCLCPVVGGAMKPTTDGRWAHLACAIWIPETCLTDVKTMEPIDGLCRINKDRWKLLCSICHVSHGACIQCCNHNCRVAFHPLCARAAGFCLETEDIERIHLPPNEEEEECQPIQLLSFCEKHRPKSNEHLPLGKRNGKKASEEEQVEYIPPVNPEGCARAEIYDWRKNRGNNGLDVPGPSSKRLYVENVPHLPGGFSHHLSLGNKMSSTKHVGSKHSVDLQKLRILQLEPAGEILSVADKYNNMRQTFRKRLGFGKSRVHGFGVFTKLPYRAGDMVIEYTGELIRASVADRREHLIYNKLVGAGTYMFRIDDERVIDATKAGSIAHLINHSCEPNCYSRVISVNDSDRIVIFAKRDINCGEELTYDYRFFSIGERLACHCGSSKCRGIVNDVEAEERVAKLCVPRSELTDWKGE